MLTIRENFNQMSKKFLYPAGGAYFGSLTIAVLMFGVFSYSAISDVNRFLAIEHVEAPFICVLINLFHVTLVESNMMVLSANTLFFYGMDKAECVPYTPGAFARLLTKHHALFNETDRLESAPRSHFARKLLYIICVLCVTLGFVITCYNFQELIFAHRSKFAFLCLLLSVDIALLINRLCFRASLRFFWGKFYKSIATALLRENGGYSSDI